MKIVRKLAGADTDKTVQPRLKPWKVLVVDDEPDVLQITALSLRGFEFSGRTLRLIEAGSAEEARKLLREEGDIALALIDVVMETDDAGLKLVAFIREELGNTMMRLIIRTGQPGIAPERYVIDNFDIDDYKDKTELTSQKLYTTVRSALKGYRDLQAIELNRIGLHRILDVTPELYDLHRDRLEDYFRGILLQVVGICNLGHSGMISTIDGLVATLDGKIINIRSGIGELADKTGNEARRHEIIELCTQTVLSHEAPAQLRNGALIAQLRVRDEIFGFIYLEDEGILATEDRELIQIMANQCAAALDSFRMHHSLEESYQQAIDMLAEVAEFKDSTTGAHIRRIEEYTRRLSLELGLGAEQAAAYAQASRLHDVGKVGIPDHILKKPGPLTSEEFSVMKRHTHIGDMLLRRNPSLALARSVAHTHHEHWDGNGYPDGLKGESIPFEARIVAVVDVFDALVSIRPYKPSWPAEKAIEQVQLESGTHLDPKMATAFIALFRRGELNDLIASCQAESR
jgi:response regulator RpfG family c-di-GMP phosphodiesterase